jgi:hypothetical protein
MKYSKEIKSKICEDYKKGLSSVKIAEKYNSNASTICRIIKQNEPNIIRSNKINSRKYYVDESYFEKIDNEHKAYWLGFLYADGYISYNNNQKIVGIALSEKDIDHVTAFKQDLNATYNIHTYQSSGYSDGRYCRLAITSDKMFDDLCRCGVVERKTNILVPPSKEIINDNLISHFIRGYFDGDGCITYANTEHTDFKITILSTAEMLNYIKAYIEENKIATINKLYKRHENDIVHNIDLAGNYQVRKFLDCIYCNATIYLQRKYDRYQELLNILHSRT